MALVAGGGHAALGHPQHSIGDDGGPLVARAASGRASRNMRFRAFHGNFGRFLGTCAIFGHVSAFYLRVEN